MANETVLGDSRVNSVISPTYVAAWVLATSDVLLKHRMDISDFPIPTDPSFANTTVNMVARPIVTETKILSRPSKVLSLNRTTRPWYTQAASCESTSGEISAARRSAGK